MFSSSTLTSCNFSPHSTTTTTTTTIAISRFSNTIHRQQPQNPHRPKFTASNFLKNSRSLHYLSPSPKLVLKRRSRGYTTVNSLHLCHNSLNNENPNTPPPPTTPRDWTTSILLFILWAALMYYIFLLTPNQTPSRDLYFLQKLLNLKGDDGFEMNQVLVSLWYIMGLWPLLYSMLLLPSGRSSNTGNNTTIPVWPFLVLSCFGGAYALLPYFVLWKPPPPSVEEEELAKWPLNFLESKLTAGVLVAVGLGVVGYAGVANGDVWGEFYQYFRESKFIHVTCIDFSLLSAFAPFWVYNDMTLRKWSGRGSWILPLTLVPFLGPALYLVLRPALLASSSVDGGGKT